MDKKELKQLIEKALEIDKSMPRVAPDGAQCLLGKLVQIPDYERSIEDLKEDAERRMHLVGNDYKLWWDCTHNWLTCVRLIEREVIKYRLMNHMSWKRIALLLDEKKLSDRVLSRWTLIRHFESGLNTIISRYF